MGRFAKVPCTIPDELLLAHSVHELEKMTGHAYGTIAKWRFDAQTRSHGVTEFKANAAGTGTGPVDFEAQPLKKKLLMAMFLHHADRVYQVLTERGIQVTGNMVVESFKMMMPDLVHHWRRKGTKLIWSERA